MEKQVISVFLISAAGATLGSCATYTNAPQKIAYFIDPCNTPGAFAAQPVSTAVTPAEEIAQEPASATGVATEQATKVAATCLMPPRTLYFGVQPIAAMVTRLIIRARATMAVASASSCMAVDIAAAITAAATAVIDGVLWSHTMKINTEVLIPASLSIVWGALIDFPRYRSWHPIVEIEGSAKEGADVEYYYRSNSEAPRGMSMAAKIKKLEPAREMVMEFGVRGFAIIEERYLLVREGTHVRLIHSANLKGLLPLIGARLFRKRITEKFQLPIDRLAHHLASKKQMPRSGRKA